jgi:phosphate transport system protein
VAIAVQPGRDAGLRVMNDVVLRMVDVIVEGVAAVTEALLAGDCDLARQVVASGRSIDALQHDLEALVEARLLDGAVLDPNEVRFLIAALRITPELERSVDLIREIARRTPEGLTAGLTGRARGLLHAMGAAARVMWCDAADAFSNRDAPSLDDACDVEDHLDDLHVDLTFELCERAMPVATAIELGLVARFYQRLGDHALSVSRRGAQARAADRDPVVAI